jgi:phosphoglycolate phosphatase
MKLLLFDIDGTLIQMKSSKFNYWVEAIEKNFKIKITKTDLYKEGKVDKQIMCELLELNNIKYSDNIKTFEDSIKSLGEIVKKGIEQGNIQITIINGVEDLIKTAIKEKHIIGLLTGNTFEKAKAKLEYVNLWKYFKIGAYGDNNLIRSELVPLAISQAKIVTNIHFKKEDVYIIGDTIRDIKCAKEAKVKSIAIATGNENFEDLKKENPDYLFKDYSRYSEIIEAIR